jgi:predicted nuclease of restriction endonuclease-like (RecB) superfamily
MNRIQDTLMELGRGFTFAGRQVRFTVDGEDQWADLIGDLKWSEWSDRQVDSAAVH